MLGCQRHLFDVPREVCYLNAASWSPLPIAVQDAGRSAVARKGRPWELSSSFATEQNERARAAAAALIGAAASDVALIPSVGYGVSSAAKFLHVAPGRRVLVLEDDHSSPVLEWLSRAPGQGFVVETVKRPADGDWTSALLEAIARLDAPPVAVASISSVHWSDGCVVDLEPVARALKAEGAALVVDFTHGAGIMTLDVAKLDPDVVIFPTYKWLLGPYGRAFMYVAPRHHGGVPLEQTANGRVAVRAEQPTYFADTSYVADARRFDMGERDHFISMEMAALGIETLLGWGCAAVRSRLEGLTGLIAASLEGMPGVRRPDAPVRAPHLLSLEFDSGMPPDLTQRLAAQNVYVAPRLGRMRISPHVYNDEADAERFVSALKRCL